MIKNQLIASLSASSCMDVVMSGKELPKIVDKSPAEIEAAIAAIESSNLQPDIKDKENH